MHYSLRHVTNFYTHCACGLPCADAGLGMFLTYATFMKKSQGAVKLGTITPLFNNIISLICGIMMFCTVFSVQRGVGQSQGQVIDTLQYNGPGNSGLTFIWLVNDCIINVLHDIIIFVCCRMPLLFGSISGGRFFAIVFFFSLSLAGLSSLIAIMEFPIHVLNDFGSELTYCLASRSCINAYTEVIRN